MLGGCTGTLRIFACSAPAGSARHVVETVSTSHRLIRRAALAIPKNCFADKELNLA